MSQLVAKPEKLLLRKIMNLHNLFLQHNDNDATLKTKELGRKVLEKEFAVAFCGHFSAGKSSMINTLIGEDILPSSPIPTSANLVKIKAGEEYARVFFKEGPPRLYPAPYDYETVKNYCKDGDQIESLEISHKGSGLLNDVIIMDTPGIDSADDAHRIATESALHLADLVLYVMDYNHVQSELNFLFTKELTDAGKELYLVVNMIDKHRDEELSFDDFQKSVANSFQTWGVRPKGIFYTSLRNGDLPQNQFSELQHFLQKRIAEREQSLPESMFKSLVKISEDHVLMLTEQAEEQLEIYNSQLNEFPQEDWVLLPDKHIEVKNKLAQLMQQESSAASAFTNEIESILKNAYLMPFKTRELAGAYLKASQPGYKAGLFFAKQKTIQERASRLESFYADLSEKVQAQLDWHLKEFLLGLLKEQGITQGSLQAMAQGFKLDFPKELLEQTIKTGAIVSGDYVLNYTNDVSEALKKLVRSQLIVFKNEYLTEIKKSFEQEISAVDKKENHLGNLVKTYETWMKVQGILSTKSEAVFEILFGNTPLEIIEEEAQALFNTEMEEEIFLSEDRPATEVPSNNNEIAENSLPIIDKSGKILIQHAQRVKLVEKLRLTAEKVNTLPGVKKIAKELKDKAERLENQQFTVALFGAFSAGKSSFANALIGENILPVSPNPTTAAINKIKPVTKENPHGTVLVKVKEAAQLLEEVNRSLKLFNLSVEDFSQALEKIATIQGSEVERIGAAEKLHYSFLRAFSAGFLLFDNRMGSVFSTDLELFRSYVADEEKSCFVDWIEVYYDCELTREGISLVDTPGADSINARHTGVAFDYIKNSDAILFVTYYNHAFSRADREFLIQLGRVKDSFELDKMFFIVNAIDLATSEEELQTVLQYVESQLVQYGIRKPHLHPVSSLQALKEKVAANAVNVSRFNQFEHAFYSFISEDLMKMAMDSAEAKWLQSVDLLEKLIYSAQEGQDEKAKKQTLLKEQKLTSERLIQGKEPEFLQRLLNQAADELIFYIKQRVFLRFGDFFREAFNPALIKDDGRDLKKTIQSALNDLLESIGYDLLQEMRATTLRVETYIGKILYEFQQNLTEELVEVNADLSLSVWEHNGFEVVDFEEAFKEIDMAMFKKALGTFKSPKAFFEKNEKKIMSEKLERLLQNPAQDYLQTQNQMLKEQYTAALQKLFSSLLTDYSEQLAEYYTGIESALTVDFPIDQLIAALERIKKTG